MNDRKKCIFYETKSKLDFGQRQRRPSRKTWLNLGRYLRPSRIYSCVPGSILNYSVPRSILRGGNFPIAWTDFAPSRWFDWAWLKYKSFCICIFRIDWHVGGLWRYFGMFKKLPKREIYLDKNRSSYFWDWRTGRRRPWEVFYIWHLSQFTSELEIPKYDAASNIDFEANINATILLNICSGFKNILEYSLDIVITDYRTFQYLLVFLNIC